MQNLHLIFQGLLELMSKDLGGISLLWAIIWTIVFITVWRVL